MRLPETKPSGSRAWDVGVCLLLGVLFLYNPFFTVHDVSGDLQVRHPLSYRATVASSELRRCTIDPAKPLVPPIEILALAFGMADPPTTAIPDFSRRQQLSDDFATVTQQVVLEGLWFRPPPASAS
jgi:hypothetical protein